MSTLRCEPNDNVDIAVLLDSGNPTTDQSRYVRTYVYDPAGAAVTGSPFALTHNANGLYELAAAYQSTTRGIYKMVTMAYTDAAFTDRDYSYANVLQVCEVRREPVFGGNDGINQLEITDKMKQEIAEKVWYFNIEAIKNDNAAGRILLNGFENIKIPEVKIPEIDLTKLNKIDALIANFKDFKKKLPDNKEVLIKLGKQEKAVTGLIDDFSNNVLADLGKLRTDLSQKENLRSILESLEQNFEEKFKFLGVNSDNQTENIRKAIILISNEIKNQTKNTQTTMAGEIKSLLRSFSAIDSKLKEEMTGNKNLTIEMINELNKAEAERLEYLLKVIERIIKGNKLEEFWTTQKKITELAIQQQK